MKKKDQKKSSFQRSAACKGKFHKNIFRPISFCEKRRNKTILQKPNESRPVQTFLGFSSPFHLKAFHLFKIKSCMRHNNERIKMAMEKQSRKLSQGNKSVKARRPLSKVLKYKKRYSSKEILSPRNICSQKYQIRTKHQAIAKGNSALKGKVLYFVSSLASNKSRLLGNVGILDISRKGLNVNERLKEHSMERRFGRSLKNRYLPREEFLMPDVTFNLENKISRFIKGKTRRRAPQPFASCLRTDVVKNRNGAPADHKIKTKLNISNLSESRNRVIPFESETQQSKSQKLPASIAFPEVCFSIKNSYHKLAVPTACQNLKVATFPLKDLGSLIFTTPDNFYCFTSTLKLGDALTIEDKKSNNIFTSLVPALKMAGSRPPPVHNQKSTRLENTASWSNKISQEIPALHGGHPSDLDAINGQREEKVLHWAVSAFENERDPQNLLQKTTRISKTNWSEDESMILLDEGIGSICKRNGVVNGTATELVKGSLCHELESIDDNTELLLPITSPNVKTDVSFPMAPELVKGSLHLELEDNTELLLPNTSPNLKADVLLPTALTSTKPVSKESMSTVMISNKKQSTIVQASRDGGDESGRSNSSDGSGEFYGLDKLDHSRRKMPGGQYQQVESTLAPISGKDFSDSCYVLGNPNSKGHLGVSRQGYNFYESANKNGRSASGGNGSGGSGGGGSGGGGQMSSTQNSSRDGGGGGSGTTSGRNGTGSCSFGRGGSTNRKPPTPCPFCGVRQAKLKRHIQLRHKDEERVKKALQLPPNLQRDVFHQFKEEGLANERNRVKDSGGTSVSGRVTGGNRGSGTSSSSTATSSTVSSSSSSGASSTSNISAGGSTSGRGTPTVGNIGSSGIGGTNIRCGSAGSSRGVMESSKIECPGTTGNIGARHDPSAMKVLCPLCDTYYEKDVLQMHMIGCSSALSHFNASDWLTGPVPLGTTDSEIDTDFLSDRSVDLGLDPNQLSLTAPLLKEEYEPPIASCSVGPLSSYKDFSGYMGMHQQPQQQMPQQQQHQQHQQHPHPGRNFPRSGNSFMPNIDGCQQMPPNYSMEMGQNPSPGNAAQLPNPYTVPSYHSGGIRHENPEMAPGNTWNQHYQQHQPQHHQQQAQQQQMYHHHQQQQSHPPPPPPQHLQPHHQQQHMQTPPPPGLPQQQQPQAHHQRSMSADPGLMYMKSPKQEFPPSSSSFQSPDNFMLPSPQMGAQISDPSLHHRPPQLYSPNSGGAGKRVPSTTTHSPHDYGTPVFNSPSHAQMSPLGGAPGYQYAPHHQIPTMPPHSPSSRSCSNFSHMDEGGYQQMMPQHCMSDQGMVRSPLVAPHVSLAPQNRHGMMQLDAAQSHGTMMGSPADNNSNTSNNNNNNNTSNNATRSLYLSSHQIEGSGNSNSNMAAANMSNSYRPPMYHNITPKTVSSSPNSSFHHSPVASPSLSSTSSSSSKNSGTYHYPTSSAPVSSGSGFSGPMYGLTDLSSSSPIGDNNNNSSNCRLGYEGMGHGGDRLGLPQQGHQLQQLAPPPPPPPPSAAAPQHQQQQPSLLSLQPLPSLMDNPSASPLLPSMSQMTPPRNHSASTTAASGGMAHMPPFAGGSSSSSSNSTNQIDPNCLMVGSCEPTLGDADRFGHQAGNMSSFNEGSSKDLADEISAAIDSHEDSSCGSSTTSGSGLSTAAGGAEWNSCSGSVCLPGTGNNGSTPTLFTASSLDNNNASNSSGSSSCGGNSPRGYSKLRNYKKPARPCPFCGVMQAKLTRHIKLKHKEDKRVVEALRLPQPLKRQAFTQFKNEGIIMKKARSSSSGPSSTDPPSS